MLPLLLVLVVLQQLLAQTEDRPNIPLRSALKLETRVMSQHYCLRNGAINVTLNLQLKFTDTGEEPLILYRKCDVPVRTSSSASQADALARKYDSDLHIMAPLISPHLITGKEPFPPQDYFIVLKPGESYFLNTVKGFRYCVPCGKLAQTWLGSTT